MRTIKSIKEAINKGLLEDIRILNCFPKTNMNGDDIKNAKEYMYMTVWDYMGYNKKYSSIPTIEYDVAYGSGIGYSICFKVSVPFVNCSNKKGFSVDDLSEIVLEIAKTKFEDIFSIKNIPLGFTEDYISRCISFSIAR